MEEDAVLHFNPFRLDRHNEQLWREEEPLRLTLKSFAVLRYLVEHAGHLVTKEDVIEAVWPETYVNETALAGCIHEIRQLLGDQARAPRFVETVHRRGYRFMAPVTALSAPTALQAVESAAASVSVASLNVSSNLVGRELEMAQLHQGWAAALSGNRQVVFVAGEAGIGKTSLVDAFIAQLDLSEGPWLGQGQCIEQYGTGEPYLPLLDALGQLCRRPQNERFIQVLCRHAPSWMIQMPGLLEPSDYETLHRRTGDATRERMLRELAEAVELLTSDHPLLLVLEDLHWSDVSTLDWLGYMARRRSPTRLLLVGSYRPVDSIVRGHPLRELTQELQRHDQCTELSLSYLPEAAIETYLTQRLGPSGWPSGFGSMLHQRTNGNPLFLVNMVNEVLRTGVLNEPSPTNDLSARIEAAIGVPESLRQLIEQQSAQVAPKDLGMRPLQAHCHFGLGRHYIQTGRVEPARMELSTAIELYRSMEMMFWLSQVEAEQTQIQL